MTEYQNKIYEEWTNGSISDGEALDAILEETKLLEPEIYERIMNSTDDTLTTYLTDEQCIELIKGSK